MKLSLFCFINLWLWSINVHSQLYDEQYAIDGARDATFHDAPFIVSLQITFKKIGHICGGTLISPMFVLSAAHCFKSINAYAVRNLMVVVHDIDSTHLNGTRYRQVRNCQDFCIHENYNHSNFDIAIVQVDKGFDHNKYTLPIQLATQPFPDQQKCFLFGWGRTVQVASIPTKILKMAEMKIDIDLTCATLNAKSEICAGNMETGFNACVGDSGGPLICDGLLAGVVSRGALPCTNRLLGTVFTNVSYFQHWIRNTKRHLEQKSIQKFRNVVPFAVDAGTVNAISTTIYLATSLVLLL